MTNLIAKQAKGLKFFEVAVAFDNFHRRVYSTLSIKNPKKGRELIESEPGCCKYNGWFYQTYNKITHCCGPDGVQELGLC